MSVSRAFWSSYHRTWLALRYTTTYIVMIFHALLRYVVAIICKIDKTISMLNTGSSCRASIAQSSPQLNISIQTQGRRVHVVPCQSCMLPESLVQAGMSFYRDSPQCLRQKQCRSSSWFCAWRWLSRLNATLAENSFASVPPKRHSKTSCKLTGSPRTMGMCFLAFFSYILITWANSNRTLKQELQIMNCFRLYVPFELSIQLDHLFKNRFSTSVSKLGDLVAQELHHREVESGLASASPPHSPRSAKHNSEHAPASNESGYKSSPHPSDTGLIRKIYLRILINF